VKKKLAIALIASLASLTAIAQGKVSFQNDSLHLVYSPVVDYSGLVADLYMGTSSSLLYLYSSTTFGPLAAGAGKWTATSVQANANAATGAPAIPGGTTVFVEVAVHTTERAPPSFYDPVALQAFFAYGSSVPFNFTLGSGVTYPLLTGPNGNWPVGTLPVPGGGLAAIIVTMPEPSVVPLAALGAVAMVFFRKPLTRQNGKTVKSRISVRVTVINGN
jgi:hypothetical protein